MMNRQFEFGAEFRQIVAESVGLLGGGRALLMQLANPLIAAAVADHSCYTVDPLGRLERTLNLMWSIIYGDRSQAQTALRRFHASHRSVNGSLRERVGIFGIGTPYHAYDPELKLWVHATMIDTCLLTYEKFVRPLSRPERERIYEDSRFLAGHFGIPSQLMPSTARAFDLYLLQVLEGNTLVVGPAALAVAHATLTNPNVWIVARIGARLIRFITAGLLPGSLRIPYGFAWNSKHQRRLEALCRFSQIVLPILPKWLRGVSQPEIGGFVGWAIRGGIKHHEKH